MRTIGGYEVSEQWTDDNLKAFGDIVFKLSSSNQDAKKQGYVKFFELRRKFDLSSWSEFVTIHDNHRVKNGFRKIVDIINDVRSFLIHDEIVETIDVAPIVVWSDKCEQLSLF